MRAERSQNREREKRRKELELLRYSHNLSHKILTLEGKEQLGPELPDAMVASFQKGSLLDRDAYWQESAKDRNFGQQMVAWLGTEGGTPGMSQWVEKQQGNETIKGLLGEVGLRADKKTIEQEFQTGRAGEILKAISADLEKAGEQPLTPEDLNENDARALIFYANYLNPTDKKDPGRDARQLIDTLVKAASKESNNDAKQTITLLQQVAPLLRVAGEEGQHILGALMVAKAHAFNSRDELIKVMPDAVLTDDEKSILDFLKKHAEVEKAEKKEETATEVLEANKPYDVQEVFTELTPEPTSGHTYWIDGEIPADFAARLTPEQLRSLELREPMWIMEGNRPMLNRKVFDPAYTLKDDKRFINAELLTGNDSGILALAAASVRKPEQQALLYQQLGEAIVRTHEANPKLVEDFLNAQTPESKIQFVIYEQDRFMPYIQQKLGELDDAESTVFEQKFGRKPNPTGQFSQEEQQFITEAQDRMDVAFNEFGAGLLANPAQYPDRLLSLREVPLEGSTSPEQTTLEIDIPATAAIWPERIKALQETLQKDPLTLTPEQIRQIEFLGHAVDTAKVVEMLQAQIAPHVEGAPISLTRPAPVARPEEVSPEVLEEMAATQEVGEQEVTQMKLDNFFQIFDDLEERAQLPQREEMALMDTSHLSEFSTEGRDVKSYEIYQTGDEQKNLAIYDLREDENGRMQHFYNGDSYFLRLLLQDNTLSRKTFENLSGLENFGPNTLIAYVLEASTNSSQQEILFRKLFSQITKMYQEHPELYKEVLDYFTSVSAQSPEPIHEMKVVEPLFGSGAAERLEELQRKLMDSNAEFTAKDFVDMGFFALPFNLQLIAQQMEEAYESHGVPQAETEPQP